MNEDAFGAKIGAAALLYLAQDPALFGRFCDFSGVNVETSRMRSQDPEFLGFVLDYILSYEPLAEAFCASEDLAAEDLLRARTQLPGAQTPHWT